MLRDDTVSLDAVAHATEQPDLRILTSGPLPPNPAELLGSQPHAGGPWSPAGRAADLVIFDSPPLQAVTDAAVLSSFVDGTLLVIDAGRSRRRVVRVARETLTQGRGQYVLGAVLNRVPARSHHQYGGYYGDKTRAHRRVRSGATAYRASPRSSRGPAADMPGRD